MSKRLRDGVMCFELQIHSKRWMMKTYWRARSQRSVLRWGGPTPWTKIGGLGIGVTSHYERTCKSIAFVDDLSPA